MDMVSRVVMELDRPTLRAPDKRDVIVIHHAKRDKKREKFGLSTNENPREKERQRKDIKRSQPSIKLKWNDERKKWLKRSEELEEEKQILLEISWRTIGIGASLLKVKQYANKVDSSIQQLKSLGSSLATAKDEKERNRIHGEIVKTEADVLLGLRKMELYSSLVPASGLVGMEKSITKKLNQRRK